MGKFLWLPRPLVFQMLIAGEETLGIQSIVEVDGEKTEDQKLFPLLGRADELEDLLAINQRFWRVLYIGTVGDYQNIRNKQFEIYTGLNNSAHIAVLVANECRYLKLEVRIFQIVYVGESGVLYKPAHYYNPDTVSELPDHMFDSDSQRKLRELYLSGEDNIEEKMFAFLDVFDNSSKCLYVEYLEKRDRFNSGEGDRPPSRIG